MEEFLFNSTPTYSDNTTTNSTSSGDGVIDLKVAIPVGLILGLIVVMTVCGNVLVLLAVFVNSHLRSTTNYFIVNLAIADLLLGTTVLPFSASLEVLSFWAFGQVFCDVWAAIDVLCCTASIMSLCVISIDRYIGVTRPLQHSTIMTEKRAVYIILLVWILSVTISIAPLIGWKEPPDSDPMVCNVTTQLGYVLFSVSGSFYIPTFIIMVVYIRIYREAVKHSKFLSTGVKTSKIDECEGVTLRIHTGKSPQTPSPMYQSSSSSEHSEGSGRKAASRLTLAGRIAKFKREKKAAKTLGIVVGVFILCWFPFFFVLPLGSLCPHCQIPEIFFKIIFWLGYCNSLMNPIIYACSSREFQRAFKRILLCQFRRRPRLFQQKSERSSSMDVSRSHSTTEVHRQASRIYRPVSLKGPSSAKKAVPQEYHSASNILSRGTPDSPLHSLRIFQMKRKTYCEDSGDDSSCKTESGTVKTLNDTRESLLPDQCLHRGDSLIHRRQNSSTCLDESSFADDEEYVNSVITNSRNHKRVKETTYTVPDVPLILIRCDSGSDIDETTPFTADCSS
ncbi:alpha-1A adrenergic receptor-like [Haliotis rubra]|uniref:alpha-1A adrenergic receptor-like n=1 Tax=Haliotis rubra TaxID=36100 RepID=UPI001EE5B215|nr:alpha-1A adrenergic receptor-like [Haliotis rubra]XP_046570211.1 alpha-1A adrenergic receptor-like [Haliotis rubra]XP_046570213.1 alpha-1A adrenergic receptor-like [Haliotis rubra]